MLPVLFVLLATPSQSPQPQTDPVRFLKENLLELRVSGFTVDLYRAGKELDVGYFGGGASEIFKGVPKAQDAMSTYRTLRVVGTILYAVGLGALILDLGLLLAKSSTVWNSATGKPETLYWVLLAGGGVTGFAGGIMIPAARGYLSDAVVAYNKVIFGRARGKAGLRLVPVPRGLTASLHVAF